MPNAESNRVEYKRGLPAGFSREDFFRCCSMPRNRELMRVFRDVDLVEHLGSGMGRILSAYDTSVFEFLPNFLKVTFPFEEGFSLPNGNEDGKLKRVGGARGGYWEIAKEKPPCAKE